MRKESVILIITLLAIFNPTLQAANARYNVTYLGPFDDNDTATAWGINNGGEVVGEVNKRYVSVHAVLFDNTGAGNTFNLGTLGGQNASALSINNNGQIVGAAEVEDSYDSFAAIFDPNGSGNNTMLCSDESGAWANNDNGQIVGYMMTSGGYWRAALFEPGSEPNIIELGPLLHDPNSGPGTSYMHSEAMSISQNSLIVGYAYNPNSVHLNLPDTRAVLFDSTGLGNNIDLGTLPGYKFSVAFSVNNSGQIVGRTDNVGESIPGYYQYYPRAVLFDPTGDGNNIDLGSLPGYDYAEAFSINNKGRIVGWASGGTGADCAVLFDPTGDGNNLNLNDLINPALGLTLNRAIAINDNGWIVAWSNDGGSTLRSFLLTPIPLGPADLNPDGYVRFDDFAIFALSWGSSFGDGNWNPDCDISEPSDGVIDKKDLKVFTESWWPGI